MKLYLVRHGQAKSKSEDPERGLTDFGKNNVKRIARFVAGNIETDISVVYHSGKKRAMQTAEIYAQSLECNCEIEEGENLHPTDDVSDWAYKLRDMEEDIMLVGHMPFMSNMVSKMACGDESLTVFDFTPGSVVCLEREGDSSWSIAWSLKPEVLKETE